LNKQPKQGALRTKDLQTGPAVVRWAVKTMIVMAEHFYTFHGSHKGDQGKTFLWPIKRNSTNSSMVLVSGFWPNFYDTG